MKKHLFLATLCSLLLACNGTEEKAAQKLNQARQAYQQGRYNEAKLQIDSIKILYPKAYDTRHEGIRLMRKVELAEQRRTAVYLDSTLSERLRQLDEQKSRYAFEKDAEYQQIGTYLHPSQVIEKNLHRSFLRFQVNETGVVSMTSIYCGATNIHHTAVKVTAPDGSFAQTPTSKDSYEMTDLEEHIEKADYKQGADGNVIEFVAINKDKRLQVEFLGDRNYKTSLTANDRQAAASIVELGQLLSGITEIKKKLEDSRVKIEFLEKRIEKDSTELSK